MKLLLLLLLLPLAAYSAASNAMAAQRTLRVDVRTPGPCWHVKITGVYEEPHEIFVVSRLSPPPPDTTCTETAALAQDEVTLDLPALPVRHIVLGRSWGWLPDRPGKYPRGIYIFPRSWQEIAPWLKGAVKVK